MIRKKIASALLAGAVLLGFGLAPAAHAVQILQNSANATLPVEGYEPIAQSFTADDEAMLFAFYFQALDPNLANDPFQLVLLAGDGTAGAQLGSATFSLAPAFEGFFDVDFSSIALTIGLRYTAVLTMPGNSAYWGLQISLESNPYGGGRAYFTNGFDYANSSLDDLRFRVTPATVTPPPPPPPPVPEPHPHPHPAPEPHPHPLPEPGSGALLALALGSLAAVARRRRR